MPFPREPHDPDRPFEPYGGFESLKGYQIAEVVYLATETFCEHFYSDNKRMTDQMVQAARSGVRNISEGSGAPGTSKKSEMLLTNVALSSLKAELLPDFQHFLKKKAEPEIAANAMICAIHQATYLINRQLKSQRRAFEEKGGFSEELYRSRKRNRF